MIRAQSWLRVGSSTSFARAAGCEAIALWVSGSEREQAAGTITTNPALSSGFLQRTSLPAPAPSASARHGRIPARQRIVIPLISPTSIGRARADRGVVSNSSPTALCTVRHRPRDAPGLHASNGQGIFCVSGHRVRKVPTRGSQKKLNRPVCEKKPYEAHPCVGIPGPGLPARRGPGRRRDGHHDDLGFREPDIFAGRCRRQRRQLPPDRAAGAGTTPCSSTTS